MQNNQHLKKVDTVVVSFPFFTDKKCEAQSYKVAYIIQKMAEHYGKASDDLFIFIR